MTTDPKFIAQRKQVREDSSCIVIGHGNGMISLGIMRSDRSDSELIREHLLTPDEVEMLVAELKERSQRAMKELVARANAEHEQSRLAQLAAGLKPDDSLVKRIAEGGCDD